MKSKLLGWVLPVLLIGLIGTAWGVLGLSEHPRGIAAPYWYGFSSGAPADYYLAAPTLSANDTAVGATATQTLTNKTLTAPVISSPPTTTSGNGAVNGATVAATEGGDGIVHVTTLTFTATPITMRDTEQGGGVKVYDFPAGRILILGSKGTVAVTTTSILANTLNASKTCNWGVGSVTQANATLATTEQDIVNVGAFTSSATINVAGAAANSYGVLTPLDGTSTAIDAFLNLAVAGADDIDGDATVTVTGTVAISWINLGDY